MLHVRSLRFRYPGSDADTLTDLDLSVPEHHICAILGGNGVGKSTLIKLILGLMAPAAGSIQLSATQAHQPIAYVPEQAALYPQLSAVENLRYFLALAKQKRTRAELENVLRAVDLPERAWHEHARGYSKGMRQKVMLALAELRQARLILLDEPNTGLDPRANSELQTQLKRLRTNASVVMVTHDVFCAINCADSISFLSNGKLHDLPRQADGEISMQALHAMYAPGVSA